MHKINVSPPARYAVREGTTFRPTPLGESLVTAYALMGMDNMWRPALRSVMEQVHVDDRTIHKPVPHPSTECLSCTEGVPRSNPHYREGEAEAHNHNCPYSCLFNVREFD